MEKRNIFLRIWIISIILHISLCAAIYSADNTLPVPNIPQEHSKWCWAACSKAVLDYYGSVHTQCEIANFAITDKGHDEKGHAVTSCCGNATYDWQPPSQGFQCNTSINPYHHYWSVYNWGLSDILNFWGVKTIDHGLTLSKEEVVAEINACRPFLIVFRYLLGGNHIVVGYGYADSGSIIYYMDPTPGMGYTHASYRDVEEVAGVRIWGDTLKITNKSCENCSYSISPTNQSFPSSGGTGTVSVTAPSGCNWAATSHLYWVTITSGSSGTGNGTVSYSVSSYPLPHTRAGNITIADKTFLIAQTGVGLIFIDVPVGYWAEGYINALYQHGITRGCGSGMYCPSQTVTRGQTAAFIIRAKFGESFSYTQTPYFSDVPSNHTFFKYVQKMKDEGMTAVSGVYGVDDGGTRGQTAAFIIRAKFGESFSYTQTPYFSDVPSNHVFFRYVQKMKDGGITAVSGVYNVDQVVPRDQMAAFIARSFLGMQ